MPERVKWMGLGYNLPVNPSKNRVYVWRKLKEFGAEYLRQGESFDKAGAYAAQGEGAKLIKHIEGDRDTVIGLPVARLLHEFPDLAAAR